MLQAMLKSADFLPWTLVGLVLALALSPLTARVLHCRRIFGFLVGLAFAGVLVVTLTPDGWGRHGKPYFVTQVHAITVSDLTHVTQTLANIAIFVPVAALLAMSVHGRLRTLFAIFGILLLPLAVEVVQYEIFNLGRTPDVNDIIQGEIGVFLGLTVGALFRSVGRLHAARMRQSETKRLSLKSNLDKTVTTSHGTMRDAQPWTSFN